MNSTSHRRRRILVAFGSAAAALAMPGQCCAASQAVLPWDYPLDALQNFAVGPLAHSVMVITGLVAMLAFALAGDSELARRMAKAAIGTAVALIAVHLLNYLLP